MKILLMAGALPHATEGLAWLISWVGDSIGLIVFAPLTLMFLPGQADAWQGRRWKLAIPSLLVTALTLAWFLQTVDLEKRQSQIQLEQRANQAKSALERNLARNQDVLEGIRSLFDAIGYVSRQEFARFTLNRLKHIAGLEALSWNPLLRSEQLDGFVRHQREEEGLPNYRIVEKTPGGALHPVRPRASHVVVAYIEPLEPNRSALGFDIQSSTARAKAIELARKSGAAQATAPIMLVQAATTQKGILLLLPVFEAGDLEGDDTLPLHGKLRGFAVGVYRIGNLLVDTLNGSDWEDLNMRLFDVTSSDATVELARYPTSRPDEKHLLATEILPVVRRSLVFAGRFWELEVHATASFLTSLGPSNVPRLLLRGLFLSGLLESFLLLVSGLERQQKLDLEGKLRTSLTAAAVSHEIKQPLTTMLFHAATIETILKDDRPVVSREDLLAAVRGMSSDARRVSITIEKIRDVLANVESNLTPINVVEPIQAALLLAKADLAFRRTRVETTGLEQDQGVLGDREQLQLVILNLLRNSMEATGNGGTVRISLRRSTHWVDLVVADDGPGFALEPVDLDRLLMASTKKQGAGIGLYVVRCVMENHKGKLEIGRSSLGGAKVRLRFPPLG
jgi:CHASE1-domain containing sensor protein